MSTRKKKETKPEDQGKRNEEQALISDEKGIDVLTDTWGVIRIQPWTYGEYLDMRKNLIALFEILGEPDLDMGLLTHQPAIQLYIDTVVVPPLIALEQGEEMPEPVDVRVRDELEKNAHEEMRQLPLLFATIAHAAMPVISATTKIKQKELRNGTPEDVLRLFITIWAVNWTVLGNAYTLFVAKGPELETQNDEESSSEDDSEK